jgi:hypothetical protein
VLGTGTGERPRPRARANRFRDGGTVPVPRQIGDGDADGDWRGVRAHGASPRPKSWAARPATMSIRPWTRLCQGEARLQGWPFGMLSRRTCRSQRPPECWPEGGRPCQVHDTVHLEPHLPGIPAIQGGGMWVPEGIAIPDLKMGMGLPVDIPDFKVAGDGHSPSPIPD